VPTLETVDAIHRSRKSGTRSGPKPLGLGETASVDGAVFGVSKGIAVLSLRVGGKEAEARILGDLKAAGNFRERVFDIVIL
jgi:hypothetical protein